MKLDDLNKFSFLIIKYIVYPDDTISNIVPQFESNIVYFFFIYCLFHIFKTIRRFLIKL